MKPRDLISRIPSNIRLQSLARIQKSAMSLSNRRVLSDWILVVADLTPFILGLAVAYWGDRIHRVSWIGALILLQSASFFVLIIPHLTHRVRVIAETPNVTHMSLYAG